MKNAHQIRAILTDVDGVLTDGGLTFNNEGIETKTFFVRDGLGIRLWKQAGYEFGLLTARTSQIVRLRGAELGIDPVLQGVESKGIAARDVIDRWGLTPEQVCYVGDDLTDLPVIRLVGLGVAVADAASEVRKAARHVTTLAGGRGCVRELIESLLKSQGRWDDLIRRYVEG